MTIVIQVLEAVDIDQGHTEPTTFAARFPARAVEGLVQRASVGNTRQAVEASQTLHGLFGLSAAVTSCKVSTAP